VAVGVAEAPQPAIKTMTKSGKRRRVMGRIIFSASRGR
jgi:hypothetical protein